MSNKKFFFLHPYELENDERMKLLDKKIPDSGMGVFWKIFYRLRRGNGTYALSGLIAEIAGDSRLRRKRLERVLNEFNLFIIENGMVSLAQGLTVSELRPRHERNISNKDKLKQVQEKIARGYDDTIMPEALRQMDLDALQRVQDDVRIENEKQLIQFQ